MSSLSPDKIEKLRALLGALPRGLEHRLVGAAEMSDPALAKLLRYCTTDPETAARDHFFAPLAPLSQDPSVARPSLACAPPAVLESVWRWIADELAPEAASAAREAVGDLDDAPDPAALDEQRILTAEAILNAIEALEDDPRALKRVRRMLGLSNLAPVGHVATLLRIAPVLRAALDGVDETLEELDEALAADLRDRYEAAVEADPDAGGWFLYMVMARLTRPWRILRVFERIAGRGDDLLVSRTEMTGIGDALLQDAEHYLAGFSGAPRSLPEAEDAASALSQFSAVTVGMTREIGIRKDGPWGQRLLKLRNAAAGQMQAIHAEAERTAGRVLPDPRRIGSRRSAPYPGAHSPDFLRFEALCRFLHLTRADASRAAVGGAHQKVSDGLKDQLDTLGHALIAQMRSGAGDRELLESILADVARLLEAFDEAETASVLVRRGAAARAA